jgi:flagellar hook-associated protein 2
MATVVGSSTGAIDVKSTVDQLIEVEMVKRIDPIDTKVTAKQASMSALTAIKTLSTSLQDSLDTFADKTQFAAPDSALSTAEKASLEALRLTNLTTAVQTFVTNYNALQAGIVKYGTVDVTDSTRDTSAKVALYGDPALQKFRQLLRDGYSAGLSYTNALSTRTDKTSTISFTDLGVSRKTDGTLAFSKSALTKSAALDTATETATFRAPADGDTLSDNYYTQPKLLDRLSSGISSTLNTNLAKAGSAIVGIFDLRTSQFNSQLYTLKNKRVSESAKIETERTRLLKTYSALNAMLANMSSTSNFLSAQLASLTKNNN